jgi:uncharacterized membrane protein
LAEAQRRWPPFSLESVVESRARIFGHSLHQILIVFPLGLLVASVGFDLLGVVTHIPRWWLTSYDVTIAGLLGGVVAAVAGAIDYWAIPVETRARRIGRLHGMASVVVLVLFAASASLRASTPSVLHPLALALSLAGATLAGGAGWLGGELVTRMGIGVADDAGVNAPGTFERRVTDNHQHVRVQSLAEQRAPDATRRPIETTAATPVTTTASPRPVPSPPVAGS